MKFEIENNVLVDFTEEKHDRNVIIPDNVSKIEGSWGQPVFSKCKFIESITIPTTVKEFDSTQFYYLKNLKWIKCEGEVSNKYDYAFHGCKNMVYIICNPNTPLSQLPKKWKNMLAIGVLKYIDEGNKVEADAFNEVKKYIKGQNKKLGLYKLGYEYPFVTKFMIIENLLSEELYDEMISYAQDNKITDVLAMLLEGKNHQYPPEELFERIEKKLDKDVKQAQKMEDHTSVTYLKTQWSWKKQEDGTLILCTYKGNDTEVSVPAMIGKNKVSSLRGFLFRDRKLERENWLLCNLKKIYISDGITAIGDGDMYGCPIAYFAIPTEIHIPQSVNRINETAFASEYYDDDAYVWILKIQNVTIYAPAGSYAEQYAKENNIPFVAE